MTKPLVDYIPPKKCRYCGGDIPQKRLRHHAETCSRKCLNSEAKERYLTLNSRDEQLSRGTMGAIAELAVCCDLLKRGYEVFRSVSPSTSCDLAVLRDNQLLRVEVTTSYIRQNGTPQRPSGKDKDKHKYDLLAYYLPKTHSIIYEPEL